MEAIILFSGGKDSFLSTLKMLEQGYNVAKNGWAFCM